MIRPSTIIETLYPRIHRFLPGKARLFFLSKLSDRYLVDLYLPVTASRDETPIGYESGWPRAYKKVRS